MYIEEEDVKEEEKEEEEEFVKEEEKEDERGYVFISVTEYLEMKAMLEELHAKCDDGVFIPKAVLDILRIDYTPYL